MTEALLLNTVAIDLSRYHRQMLLPNIGEEGQRRLLGSHALVVGCGALGCVSADLLARAGVGTITIVDRDVVELTNLQRQTLFDERDATEGIPKAIAAERRLRAINSGITIRGLVEDFTHRNAAGIIGTGDAATSILIDGTDNFETRYLLNDLSVKLGLPYLYAGVVGTTGMQATFVPGKDAPCLRCLFEHAPPPGVAPTCDTAGVLGPAVAVVASLQAADASKLLSGHGKDVSRTLTSVDLWTNQIRQLDIASARNPNCPCCVNRYFPFLDGEAASATTTLCGRESVQISPAAAGVRIDLSPLAQRLRAHGTVSLNPFLLRCTLSAHAAESGAPLELTVFPDARAIIKGTKSTDMARSIYAKYVGA